MPVAKFINHRYFKTIDSRNKAYIVGFLCADGCIYSTCNKVSCGLNIKDIEVLRFIKKELESDHKISKYKTFDKRTRKYYYGCKLSFSSKFIQSDLCRLGVTSNKSNFLEFPKIKEKFKFDFLRGYLDGDGYISRKRCCISVISTEELLSDIKKLCQDRDWETLKN